MLDKRLEMCMELVGGEGIVCDIGTDHAYLAAELIKSGKCEKVIAADINEGPLEAAAKTVEKYGLSDRITLILSDGLENVPLDNVSDVVIAGMGGETIAGIIGETTTGVIVNASIDKCDFESIRWILQPMTKPEILRKWLIGNGFEIISETGVEENEKLYTVITARYSAVYKQLTEFEALRGFFRDDDEMGKKIRQKEAEKLNKVSQSLEKAGKLNESGHYAAMASRIHKGNEEVSISDIYSFLNEKYPFALQEGWDNSGYLVESETGRCSKILLTLDITNDSIEEAADKGAGLIISHHPVIFNPLKKVQTNNPVYKLIRNGTGAICMHTNLDIAEGGTNTAIVKKIAEKLAVSANIEPLEDCGLGCIIEFEKVIDCEEFAAILKDIFKIDRIKTNIYGEYILSKIAVCSGSGGSLWKLAKAKGCDALITGDVKHDIWIDTNNAKFTVFDCGHFHTENLVLEELRYALEKKFPQLDVEISERSTDPCEYI